MEGLESVTSGIGKFITNLGSTIGGFFSDLLSGIGDFFTSLFEVIGNGVEAIGDFFSALLDGLIEALKFLFVPETNLFNEAISRFREKFAFIDCITSAIEMFIDAIRSYDEFGAVEVNLSNANSDLIAWSGSINLLDMSWYTPYKSHGDGVISAFLWIVFIYNTFRNLPSIINGAGSIVHATGSVSSDSKND